IPRCNRTSLSGDDVIQRRARVLSLRFGAVRIGTVLQEPLDWRWLHRLARCKEDRELRPAGKSIETSNLELRISERPSVTRLEQILGLICQMQEIGTVRKRRCVLRMGRNSDLLSTKRPSSAHRAERRLVKIDCRALSADWMPPQRWRNRTTSPPTKLHRRGQA